MIKIIDVKLKSNHPMEQTVFVSSLLNIEVEVMENNWLHIANTYSSWAYLRDNFLNWNDIKNI